MAADAQQPPGSLSPEERTDWVMTTLLKRLERSSSRYHNVPSSDGRFLYDLIRQTQRKTALEFGSANGYSAIWMGLGLVENGGKLDTVEINPRRSDECRENIRMAGLQSTVNCITGDALRISETLDGEYDFFFIDLGTMEMLPFLKSVEGKLAGDAVIALHNIGFERSYRSILKYAQTKGWSVDRRRSARGDGYGFFIITKEPDTRSRNY